MHRGSHHLLFILLGIVIAGNASAHAMLESSEPAAGEELKESPPAVILHFDSLLEPAFCAITVQNRAGDHTISSPVQSVDGEGTALQLNLPALPEGRYRVLWRAAGRDGHRTTGDYEFTIKQ